MLFEFFRRMKAGTEELNYGRDKVALFARRYADRVDGRPVRVLDLGVGHGDDLMNVKAALAPRPIELHGVEAYAPYVAEASAKGIRVAALNIERDRLPYEDGSVDIVVANQIIEHTKDVFWIFGEISRVLRPGGVCIVGVPNLASLHNRVLLLFGAQPSSIEMLGPHDLQQVYDRELVEEVRLVERDAVGEVRAVLAGDEGAFHLGRSLCRAT